jgi:uncharacterized membrane-anchored protein YhcB (DUF1043 family)
MNVMNSLIFLVIGIAIGYFVSRLFSKPDSTSEAIQKSLEQNQAELEAYRQQVSDHFSSSAKLLEDLAQQYQAVYTHMARQSKELMGDGAMQQTLFSKVERTEVTPIDDKELPPKDYANGSSGLLKVPTKAAS